LERERKRAKDSVQDHLDISSFHRCLKLHEASLERVHPMTPVPDSFSDTLDERPVDEGSERSEESDRSNN
jgi:hypothetical protein